MTWGETAWSSSILEVIFVSFYFLTKRDWNILRSLWEDSMEREDEHMEESHYSKLIKKAWREQSSEVWVCMKHEWKGRFKRERWVPNIVQCTDAKKSDGVTIY